MSRRRALGAAVMATMTLAACSGGEGDNGGGAAISPPPTTSPPSTTARTATTVRSTSTTSSTTSSTASTTVAGWRRFPLTSVAPPAGTPVLRRIDTTDRVVFITIDDGYSRDPRVPDLLAEHGATATLFPVSGVVRADPQFFARFLELGGTVNSHTVYHDHLPNLDAATQRREVCGAAQSIANSLGGVGPFFRPPYGEWNSDTVAAARSCRLRAVVLWSVSVNKGFIATHGGPIKTGDIILMHFREELYTDLQAVFAELDRLGLSVARLEDYLPAA